MKNITNPNSEPKYGDLGVNQDFNEYIYTGDQWTKFDYDPKIVRSEHAILQFVEEHDGWLTVHDIPHSPLTARKTLEHLHKEGRIYKGPNDTYANEQTWNNANI